MTCRRVFKYLAAAPAVALLTVILPLAGISQATSNVTPTGGMTAIRSEQPATVLTNGKIPAAQIDVSQKNMLQKSYGKLPLYFMRNDGQVDGKVRFYERGSGHATYFTKEGVSLSLSNGRTPAADHVRPKGRKAVAGKEEARTVRLIPLNANRSPEIVAEEMQAGKINYFIGNDPKK